MSGTVDHNQAAADVLGPALGNDNGKFYFKLVADDKGVQELGFRKDAPQIFATLLFVLEYINNGFDTPYPTTGDFIRELAATADRYKEIEDAHKKSQDQSDSKQVSEPKAD